MLHSIGGKIIERLLLVCTDILQYTGMSTLCNSNSVLVPLLLGGSALVHGDAHPSDAQKFFVGCQCLQCATVCSLRSVDGLLSLATDFAG